MKKEWILLIFKKFWKLEILILIIVLFHTVLSLLDPYVLKFIIDKAIIPRNVRLLFILLIILTSILLIRHLSNVIAGYLYRYAGSKLSFYLRELILTRFLSSNYVFFEEYKKGDIITRVTEDIANLESFLTETLIDIIMNCLSVIIIFCFLFILNWKLALITILILPFAPLSMRFFRNRIHKTAREEREAFSEHLSFWENILSGLKEITVYRIQNMLQNKFKEIARRCVDRRIKLQFLRMTSGFTGEVISTLVLFPLIFGYGSYLIFKGEFTLGGLISFHTYTMRAMFPLLFLFRLQILLSTLKASIERIDEIYNLPMRKTGVVEFQKIINIHNYKNIYFKDVTFKYKKDGEEILKNVSFRIPLKTWTCIIGEIGSGKTTIAYLLLKFLKPGNGKILIDNIPLENIEDEIWYRSVSYVGQFPFIFNFSIEENILMGRKKDEKFEQIVNLLGIKGFLEKIGRDLRDKAGEISEKLSGGEKQKICIARAFLKGSPILILDEATSNMDINTEKELLETLRKKQIEENKTIIFITHRFSPLLMSDYVIFISKGKVEGEGKFEELKNMCNKFRDYLKKHKFKG